MREVLLLFCLITLLRAHLISGPESLAPSELLDSISLSDENVALFQPENVTETNEKLRLLVQKLSTLDEVCESTAKPILCRKTLKWPIRNLQLTYAQLANWHEAVEVNGSLMNKWKLQNKVANAKEHLARLQKNTVLIVTKLDSSDHGH